MLDNEQRKQALGLIRDIMTDAVLNYFGGLKTEDDVKKLITSFKNTAALCSVNAAILEDILSDLYTGKNDEAKK